MRAAQRGGGSGVDGGANGPDSANAGDEVRYVMAGYSGAGAAAFVRADVVAPLLGANVEAVTGTPVLAVRAVPVSGWPVVRLELLADHAAELTRFMQRFMALVETGDVPPFPGCGATVGRRRRTDDIDLSAMHPTWYAYVPGVDFVAGYERAYEVLPGLEDVISRVVAVGVLAIDPACNQNGEGAVRVDMTPDDAEGFAYMLEYAAKFLGGVEGGGS
jgi:hypothetical protein